MPEPEENSAATARLPRNPLLDRTVRERARAGNADSALHLLTRTKGLDVLYGGQLRAEIAQSLFSQGRDELALRLAQGALRQSGGRIGLGGIHRRAGCLAARQRPVDAQGLFEAANRAEVASPSLQAGCGILGGAGPSAQPGLFRLRALDAPGRRWPPTPSTACSPGAAWGCAPWRTAAGTRSALPTARR